MNIEEKRRAIEEHCALYSFCTFNQEKPCPLHNVKGACYSEASDMEIELNYEILVKHGFINDESTDDEDIINHPNHYTNGGMECIDEMILIFGEETVAHFCLCNAWKYRYRAMSKNGQEDIDKSHWYINKYKELVERTVKYVKGGVV